MNGAEILTKFTADDSQLTNTIKNVSKVMSGLSGGLVGVFASGMKTSVKLLTEALKASVSAYGELEQLSGGAQKIFDEMDYSQIEKDAVEAYKNMNMSAREYLGVINTVGASFASTLGDEKGYAVAKEGLQALSDFATGTGLDLEKLSSSFTIIAKSTKNYQRTASQFAGILPTTSEAFLEQAQATGLLSKEYKKLNDVPVAEYQEALTKMMTKGTEAIGLQGNTLMESTKTLSGSILALKSAWDNFLSGVGDTKTVVKTAVTALKQIAKGISEMLPTVTDGIVELLDGLIPMIPPLVEKLFPPLLQGAISLLQGIIDQLPTFISMLASMLPGLITGLIQGFTQVVNTLASQAPVLIPTIIQAIMDSLLALIDPTNIDQLITSGIALMLGLVEGLSDSLPILIEMVPKIIESLIVTMMTDLPKMQAMGPKLLLALAKGLINAIPSIVLQIPRIIRAIIDGFKQGITNFKEVGGDMIKGLWSGLSGMKDWAISKVKSLGKQILKGLKDVLGIASPSKEFAIVGHYSGEGYIEGLEDMQKDIDKTIDATFNPFNSSTLGSMSASTPQANITIQNSMNFDALGQLVNEVKTFSGGAKNDYNYVGGY